MKSVAKIKWKLRHCVGMLRAQVKNILNIRMRDSEKICRFVLGEVNLLACIKAAYRENVFLCWWDSRAHIYHIYIYEIVAFCIIKSMYPTECLELY